jgi:hypothetical protein
LLGDGPAIATYWDETELAAIAAGLAQFPESGLPALRMRDRDGNDVSTLLGAGGLVLRFNTARVFYYYGSPAIGSGLAVSYEHPVQSAFGAERMLWRTASLPGADPRALSAILNQAIDALRG